MSESGLLTEHQTGVGGTPTGGSWGRSGGGGYTPTSPLDRRGSQGRIVDQRLDPAMILHSNLDDSSRVSVRSLQDDRDYSRPVLRVSHSSVVIYNPLVFSLR